jgi:hypothetical protein
MHCISGPRSRGGAVGWGIVLQAARLRVRFPMEFFIAFHMTVALKSTQPPTEKEHQEYFLGRKDGRFVGLCRLSNSGSLNLLEPFGPVIGPHRNLLVPYVSGPGWVSILRLLSKQCSIHGNYLQCNKRQIKVFANTIHPNEDLENMVLQVVQNVRYATYIHGQWDEIITGTSYVFVYLMFSDIGITIFSKLLQECILFINLTITVHILVT